MRIRKQVFVTIAKLVLAALLLAGIAGFLGKQMAPGAPWSTIFIVVIGLLAVVVLGTLVSLTFSQFILRQGGTDAQWFWFSSEPEGLVKLRREAAAQTLEQQPCSRQPNPLASSATRSAADTMESMRPTP